MYEDFYGLKEKPFTLTPDPKFLYLSEPHRAALEHLIYSITQKEGFTLITGDVGTGKTTICRALLERLDQKTKTALILNPQISEEELLYTILSEFEITALGKGKKGIIDTLNQFLLQQLVSGGKAVLIIDEAQNLSLSVMEQIRLLSNLETEKEKLLQIILVGQPELHTKLELPLLRQLNQRISVRYHLSPLTKSETRRYIEHRLVVAGSEGAIYFSNRAISLIYKYSQGIPRLINLISDRCLLGGYSKQATLITPRIVKGAVESLGGKRIFPVKGLSFQGRTHLSSLFPISWLESGESSLSKNIISSPKDAPGEYSPKEKATPTEIEKQIVSYHYTIYLGSYSDKKLAFNTYEELQKRGYAAYVSQGGVPGERVWYQLLLGKFKTKDAANEILQELKAKEVLKKFPGAVVVEKTRYVLGKAR